MKKRSLIAIIVILAALVVGIYYFTSTQSRPGDQIFKDAGCFKCHMFKGVGLGNVDLTDVTRHRSDQWIQDQIRNPKSHNPSSAMPSFEDKLNSAEIKSLIKYFKTSN
jgi:mono/diheme cytochrome c family protein